MKTIKGIIGLVNYNGGNYRSVANILEYLNINFIEIKKNFVILDSLKGNLVVGNNIVATFSGFSRGLSFDGKYYYIGQSRNRNYSLINNKKSNVSIDNTILIYDENKKISSNLPLPYNISEIHEVLVV